MDMEKAFAEMQLKLAESQELTTKQCTQLEALKEDLANSKTENTATKTLMDNIKASMETSLKKTSDKIIAMTSDMEKAKTASKEMQAKMDAPGGQMMKAMSEFKSIGEMLTTAEGFESLAKSQKASMIIDVNTSLYLTNKTMKPVLEAKALSDTSLAALQFIDSHRRTDIVDVPRRELTIRDLLGYQRVERDVIDWVEQTGFNHLYAKLAALVTIGGTTFTLANGNGFFAGQVIKLGAGDNEETLVVESVEFSPDEDTRDNATVTVTTNFTKDHAKECQVTADIFAWTPRTNLKPSAQVSYAPQTTSVLTLAHNIPMTKQALSDHSYIQARINNDLMYGLDLSVEDHILYGSGVSGNMQGILTHSGILTYSQSSGEATDSKADAIRRALTLQSKAGYQATGIVLSPEDYEDIELQKDSNGRYMNISSVMEGGIPKLWRIPVAVSQSIEAGTALIGAFGLGAFFWDREQGNIQVYEQHADFAQRNMLLIQAEMRCAMTIDRPEAFVAVTFDGAPSA